MVLPAYRLNVFGFLASQELAEEDSDRGVGNYGFWDQRAALEWITQNIVHFKGDPTQITLGGFSAGMCRSFLSLVLETSYDLLSL